MVFSQLLKKQQELKHKIHSTRIPLSKNGQVFMGFVYFSIPMVIGYGLYHWTLEKQKQYQIQNVKEYMTLSDQRALDSQNKRLKSNLKSING